MNRRFIALAFAAQLVLPTIALAQHSHEPMTGVRNEAWLVTWDAAEKAMELAEAMPANKFAWRPAKDVRSVAEVYMHIAQANYFLPMLMGSSVPMATDVLQKYDTSEKDKAKVQQALKTSYDFAKHTMEHMQDSELDQQVDFFGKPVTKRMLLMILAAHSHEHLGQAIAYARMNGIVPPWTARQNAAAADKKKADGEKKGY